LAILPFDMKGPITAFTHRGLSPHQFTPMSGAHHPNTAKPARPLGFHLNGQERGLADSGR
jgi:hypothetical protein